MARDRKRAKDRRRRREGATPTPSPLEGATPYADEARLAEAGADVPGPDGPAVERAPDEVEGDLVPASARGFDPAVAEEVALAGGSPRRRGRLLAFLGHCVDELRRVQWPDRRHVGQATGVVLAFVIIAGSYLGALDALWNPVVKAII